MAAFVNLTVAVAMLAAPSRVAMHLSLGGPGAPYVVAMLGLFIGVFGIGYAIVARDPVHNRGVVWAGMFSKFGIAVLAAVQFAAQTIEFRTFAAGMADFVFAILFAMFLWRTRR